MTDDRLPLAELMAKTGDGDFLRTVAESVLQIIMEADVDGLIGAGRHERSGDRSTWRNGYRDRALDTRLGTLKRFGHLKVLVHASESPAQSPAVLAQLAGLDAKLLQEPGDRFACIVASSLLKMQAQRTLTLDGSKIFISENAAITWLLAFVQKAA